MKKLANHIYWGLVTSALIIIAMVILFSTNFDLDGNIRLGLIVGLIISGVYKSCKVFVQKTGNTQRNEIFFNGFRTTAIVALVLLAFLALSITIIPSIKANMVANYSQIELQQAANDATLIKTANQNIATYASRFMTYAIGFNLMIIVISGLIGSVIGAIFGVKK